MADNDNDIARQEMLLKHIAEAIHDNMGQVLSLVVLNLSAVELDDKEAAAARILRSTELVQQVIADLRDLLKKLDAENMLKVPMALPTGLSSTTN